MPSNTACAYLGKFHVPRLVASVLLCTACCRIQQKPNWEHCHIGNRGKDTAGTSVLCRSGAWHRAESPGGVNLCKNYWKQFKCSVANWLKITGVQTSGTELYKYTPTSISTTLSSLRVLNYKWDVWCKTNKLSQKRINSSTLT